MIRYFISFTLFITSGFSAMIGGISMSVDNEPITIYEIKNFSKQNNISTQEAVNMLVQSKIEDIEIKKLGIVISPYDVEEKLKEIAKQNGMDYEAFKKALIAEGQSEQALKQDIENKLKRDQLYKKIVSSKLKKPDEEELKSYYEQHKSEFNMPTSVDLIEYLSPSMQALELQQKQPMINMENIQVTTKTIDLKSINPQLAQLLTKTQEGTFTPVLNLGNQGGMFFIQKKRDIQKVSYEMAKGTIFEAIMKSKEQAALVEYFEKKKSEANVKVVRRVN